MRQLLLDALHIVTQRLLVQEVAFLTLPARVAYHACGSAYEGDGLMTAALQVTKHHHAAKVAYVQTVCRRVYAHISRYLFFQ